uniref:Uncharacterized protein n=1 Tax=Panagrellus redivivus TaxID=6233 RepID=A0A7E4VY88_PANRE
MKKHGRHLEKVKMQKPALQQPNRGPTASAWVEDACFCMCLLPIGHDSYPSKVACFQWIAEQSKEEVGTGGGEKNTDKSGNIRRQAMKNGCMKRDVSHG